MTNLTLPFAPALRGLTEPAVRRDVQRRGPSRVWPRRRTMLVLAALMACSTAFSALLLTQQSLRLDEAQSLWQTSHSFGRMYQLVAQDVHVPGYHTVLKLWIAVFGHGVATTRALSLVLFVLTIPAVYALGRRVFDERDSLFAAALVALSPFLTWYGNEIRMYAALALVVVLNQLCFLRIFQRAARANWTFYALTAVVGIYTHYFFWLTLLTQGVFYLVNRRRFARGSFLRLATVAGLLLVALAPWLLFVRSQGGSGGNQPLLLAPTSVDLFNTFSQFFAGFQDNFINTLLVAMWPMVVLLSLLALQKTRRVPPEIGYFLLMGLLPVLAAFTVAITVRPVYVTRYLIVALPSLLLFLTWLLTVYGRRTALLLRSVLLLGLVAASLQQALSPATPVKEDYRAASDYLASAAAPQDIVVISPPFTSYPFDYYWNGAAALTTLPAWNRVEAGAAPAFDAAKLPEQAAALKVGHHDAWLVLSYDQGYQDTVVQYFDATFQRLEARPLSAGLIVYHYRLRYDLPDTAALIDSLNKVAK